MGLPVFLRFRMSSDVATAIGGGGGWYIDNLVINNLTNGGCPLGLAKVDAFYDALADRLPSRACLLSYLEVDMEITDRSFDFNGPSSRRG
jgi:hypothetical protein